MRSVLFTLFLFVSVEFSYSQSNEIKARLEFEKAERAVEKYNYEEALKALTNTEELLNSWTPKVSFLKIISQNSLLVNKAYKDTFLVSALKSEVNKYMAFYEKKTNATNAIPEKFQLVYEIENALKSIPNLDLGNKFYAEKDFENALKEYQKAADMQNVLAMNILGRMFKEGKGTAMNSTKAIEHYEKAAALGSSDAYTSLGMMFQFVDQGTAINHKKAMEYYLKAADMGNAKAMFYLSILIDDNSKSVEWLQKSADGGNLDGMFVLGSFHQTGYKGLIKDINKTLYWYQKAAEGGSCNATSSLASLYMLGFDVPIDFAKAVQWNKKTIENINPDCLHIQSVSMNYIGEIYEKGGNGIEKNLNIAIEWYQKATEAKNYDGILNLARLYEEGKGVAKDKKKAKELIAKAEEILKASQSYLESIKKK